MKATWSPEQIAVLVELYPLKSNDHISIALSRSADSITGKAKQLRLRKSPDYLATVDRGVGSKPIKRDAFLAATVDLVARSIGASVGELAEHTQSSARRLRGFLARAIECKTLFMGGGNANARYFSTAEAVASGMALVCAAKREKRAAYLVGFRQQRRNETASLRAARKAAKPPKPAKVPKPPRPPKPPKVKAVRVVKLKSARCFPEKTRRAIGPAMRNMQADYSNAIRTVIRCSPGRYEVSFDYLGPFSLAGIGRDAVTGQVWQERTT